jgi:hypothetical protein
VKENEIQTKVINPLVAKAQSVKVTDDSSYKEAAEFLKAIKEGEKVIHDEFDPGISDAHSLHKKLVAQREKFLEPLGVARYTVDREMSAFTLLQRKKRQEEQLRLEAELKKQQEKEREAENKEGEVKGKKRVEKKEGAETEKATGKADGKGNWKNRIFRRKSM